MFAHAKPARRGAMTVETAMVMFPLVLFLFSIFEYGRFVMVRQLTNHAAREACRHALVYNQSATLQTDVAGIVQQHMAGSAGMDLQNFSVVISAVDSAGNDTGTSTTAIQGIQPGDPIAVKIQGDFKTMFPTLFYLPVSIPMVSKVIMTCEGD